MNQMKRLGIFCFFEKDGIVDQYVEYLICDLKKNLEKLVVVINGDIRNEGIY
jgi:rhamnosyltransferase